MDPFYKQLIDDMTTRANQLMYGAKDHDYNNKQSTIDIHDYFPYGFASCHTMLNKHFTRLRSLYEAGAIPKNESIQDNWIDLTNYIRICYAVMENRRIQGIAPMAYVPVLKIPTLTKVESK